MADDDDGDLDAAAAFSEDDLVAWVAACVMIAEKRVRRPHDGELGNVSLADWVAARVPAEAFGRTTLSVAAMHPAERGMYIQRAFPDIEAVQSVGHA